MEPHIVYISVGSDLGNRLENCETGINFLLDSRKTRLLKRSRVYETEPVDYTRQEWFINLAVKIETDLDPFALLQRIRSVQRRAGRIQDTVRFGPRVLDLDILLFDDFVLDDPQLCIPHPRMHKRRFVLKPICDIDPDIIHPVLKQSMHQLLHDLDAEDQKIVEYT